jgi:hypothetical protein
VSVKYISVLLTKGDLDEEWWDKGPMCPSLSVDGATMEFTGIVDASNNPIMKLPRPIGFGRDNEW